MLIIIISSVRTKACLLYGHQLKHALYVDKKACLFYNHDIMTNISFDQFADEEFAITNREAFDAFIDYRVEGIHQQVAFVRLFGDDSDSALKSTMMMHNPYVRREFARKVAALKPKEIWTENMAAVKFKEFMENPFFKDSTRLQAAKELNVLMGITEIDDAGRSVKRRGLSDLYKAFETESQSKAS